MSLKLYRFINKVPILKSDIHLQKKCLIYFIESSLQIMKNGFYFILEALLVVKIFKFLSGLFSHDNSLINSLIRKKRIIF